MGIIGGKIGEIVGEIAGFGRACHIGAGSGIIRGSLVGFEPILLGDGGCERRLERLFFWGRLCAGEVAEWLKATVC
jgi:hypothetical protein